jgi:hypothetical protein
MPVAAFILHQTRKAQVSPNESGQTSPPPSPTNGRAQSAELFARRGGLKDKKRLRCRVRLGKLILLATARKDEAETLTDWLVTNGARALLARLPPRSRCVVNVGTGNLTVWSQIHDRKATYDAVIEIWTPNAISCPTAAFEVLRMQTRDLWVYRTTEVVWRPQMVGRATPIMYRASPAGMRGGKVISDEVFEKVLKHLWLTISAEPTAPSPPRVGLTLSPSFPGKTPEQTTSASTQRGPRLR